MTKQRFFILFLIEFIIFTSFIARINGGIVSSTLNRNLTYTAAVVEFKEVSLFTYTRNNVVYATEQFVAIIQSAELNGVDIVVFPETILNRQGQADILPNTNKSYCDEPKSGYILRSIACAARKAKKYVVINAFAKIKCSLDDQPCSDSNENSTNLYTMAIVFDRNGCAVAKYRKYNLFGDDGARRTEKPDIVTFKTDFNVTFGIGICFDLAFDEPMISLVRQGIKHFVYPTRWISKMPYFTAAQFQQSWAYANDVNLLAANVNSPEWSVTGSGIYSGRSGALKVFVSEAPTTKVLIAKVPVNMPADYRTLSIVNQQNSESHSQLDLKEEDLSEFTMEFLNLTENHSPSGAVCTKDICCNYTVEASDNGEQSEKSSYSYAISVFSGHRRYEHVEHLLIGQDVCSLIACADMNDKLSCGVRFPKSQVHHRYKFTKLNLQTTFPMTKRMKIMPNTLTQELLPLNINEFDFKLSEVRGAKQYKVALNLKKPKENLLTFAVISRDFDRDEITKSPTKIRSLKDRIVV
ncbi:vanin-like protein 1 [Contarinia nasturtii]|uniref:vanin-like protein 1 n=1 Tax=Contarinia nasturtii TaxID=265458 RepID=UPI0012D3A626|nr:vanin-like protein 1 [Contarinia nasturtii]